MNCFSSVNQGVIKDFLTSNGYTDIEVEEGALHTSFMFCKDGIKFTFELRLDDDCACDTHCLEWESIDNGRLYNYQNKRWSRDIDTSVALATLKRRLNKFNKLENKFD